MKNQIKNQINTIRMQLYATVYSSMLVKGVDGPSVHTFASNAVLRFDKFFENELSEAIPTSYNEIKPNENIQSY